MPHYPKKSHCDGEFHEKFKVNNLVSNTPNVAHNQDPYLIDSWNIVIVDKNDMWVCNKGTAFLTNYDLLGNIISNPVKIPDVNSISALPTGLIVNESTGFVISSGSNIASSYLLIATENGAIFGFNPLVDPSNAVIAVDNSSINSCYKGIAMINNYLCAADFHNNRIDVFDFNFVHVLTLPFADLEVLNPIPVNYAPFNIVNINNYMFVTYAKQSGIGCNDDPGKGHGYVSIFNYEGLFVKRFISNGKLNSPYGIIKLPESFGDLGHNFLIGNNGNGKLNVYNHDGKYVTTLKNKHHHKIIINGLHGFAKYHDDSEYDHDSHHNHHHDSHHNHHHESHRIFFGAGSTNSLNGLVGTIKKDKHCR
jgi:uncharacterized protein (TIGR03118 family)